MQKIPTVFVRDFDNNPAHVLPRVTPAANGCSQAKGRPPASTTAPA